jgi:hypothetical protein
MPTIWGDLPPDHPIFSTGPSFVFKNDLPPEDEAELEPDNDESPPAEDD